jgi:hypothetical protein
MTARLEGLGVRVSGGGGTSATGEARGGGLPRENIETMTTQRRHLRTALFPLTGPMW